MIVFSASQKNYATIANYFENRSTNASAESFNAKVKAFKNQFRGVSDIPFFVFRLATTFACFFFNPHRNLRLSPIMRQ
ncbi:MAG: transposase [Alistipes sp.]|nr:transposase [Alistipes sp.]